MQYEGECDEVKVMYESQQMRTQPVDTEIV
jgi:hypothetical protein